MVDKVGDWAELNFDLKSHDNEFIEAIVEFVEKNEIHERVILSSFFHESLDYARSLCSDSVRAIYHHNYIEG